MRLTPIVLGLALASETAAAHAQTSTACGGVLTVRDGRVATRAPEVEPAHWTFRYPQRQWQDARLRSAPRPATESELTMTRVVFGRMARDDPHRPDVLVRMASEAISIANDRAASIDDDPPANGFGCARELWRSMGWLLPGAPLLPLRETITTSCGYARVALETLLREHPGSPNESYGCSVLVGLLLEGEDFAAGEALAVRCHNPWALYNVAHHLDERGLSAEAALWFERALSATDDQQLVGQANHRLGLLRLEAGDHLGAVAHFEASMAAAQLGENDRGYALAHARLLLARGTWSPEETATRIGAAVRSWEQHRVFADVLVALAAAGRTDWALAGFRLLRRLDPENAAWALDEALLLGEVSSRREAIAAYDRLLHTTSEPGNVSRLWHPIYVAAAQWHREALRATPPDREQLRDAARLYALVGTAWRLRVPNWSRSVLPGRPELRSLYRAEALFEAGDSCEAAYLEALRDDAEPALAPEIRCKATLCRARRSDASPTTR